MNFHGGKEQPCRRHAVQAELARGGMTSAAGPSYDSPWHAVRVHG